jgi:LmbE family N-acetylglucosaminyl deacetylase
MGRTLAVVVAHPDDESYSTYGTVARYADDPLFRLVVLHATDGEGGEIADGVPATRETLGAWRRQEDDITWRALGRLPDRHDWLAIRTGAWRVSALMFYGTRWWSSSATRGPMSCARSVLTVSPATRITS